MTDDTLFTPYTPVDAVGARVMLLTCKLCGAVIMLDPRQAPTEPIPSVQHRRYHDGRGESL